jgi:hypothetical protein
MTNKTAVAKKLLDKKGIHSIKPIQLAQASTQLNKSLIETLRLIAHLKGGAQGGGPFPHTTFALKGKHG